MKINTHIFKHFEFLQLQCFFFFGVTLSASVEGLQKIECNTMSIKGICSKHHSFCECKIIKPQETEDMKGKIPIMYVD